MRKVFLDLGANKGQSIEQALHTLLKDTDEYTIHSFEPNPDLCFHMMEKYRDNSNIHIHNKAVWYEPDTLKFYTAKDPIASSLLIEKKTGNLNKDRYIETECIDISLWIEDNLDKEDYNIFKIDIEGAEYFVLPHLIKNNTLEYFNEFHGEWHLRKLDDSNKFFSNTEQEIKEYFKENGIEFHNWDATLFRKR